MAGAYSSAYSSAYDVGPPANTATAAAVQAAQIMAMSGTNTPPFVPPVPGQNRMGGTGAIRKPPR